MSTIIANGIEIYYEISGHGQPLTLIMGLCCSARQWQWMLPLLAESFQVIAFDNRGAGRTGKPDMEYTTDLFAEDTHALLDALGIEQTHIFGASVGGMIAQKFALHYPDKVDRLVLGCTMPNSSTIPPAPNDLQMMQESQLVPLEDGVEMMMRLFVTERFFKEEPDQVAMLREVMMIERKEQGQDALYRQLAAAMKHDTVHELKDITVPTLIIAGTSDRIAPIENSRFLAEQIPNTTLAELSGRYHAFWVEGFEEASDGIVKFLIQ